MHQSIHSILSQTQLFDSISDSQLESIAEICESAVLPKGYILIQENEASDALYIVGSGGVEITINPAFISSHEEDAKEQVVLAELMPGQVFGEIALVDQGIRSATAKTTADDSFILRIPREALMGLCDSDPIMGYNLMKNLAADLALKMRNMGLTVRQYQLMLSHTKQ